VVSEMTKKRLTGTKQWAPISKNCCLGCLNDCRYCYAKLIAILYKRATKDNRDMRYNPNCEREIRKYKGRIMFPTAHDLHIEHKEWWMPFLTGLLKEGNDILIVSKPQFEAIYHICKNLSEYLSQIEFRFTIGTYYDKTRKFWEPHAPSIHDRVAALHCAGFEGFRTSVSIEPLLDRDPTLLIRMVDPFVTETIWIGMMNHMERLNFTEEELPWYHDIQHINSLANIQDIYSIYKDHPKIRWKDSIEKMLGLEPRGIE